MGETTPSPASDRTGLHELVAEIRRLSADNRARPDRERERRLLRLRHLVGISLLESGEPGRDYADPAFDRLTSGGSLPTVTREDLTAGLLRAAILRDGSLLVRGLVDREEAVAFAREIEEGLADRARGDLSEGRYEEFQPEPGFASPMRDWMKDAGGMPATDAPGLSFRMLDLFEGAGLPGLVESYLGEPVVFSAQKTVLRRAEPDVGGAWHQDGRFMGEVRSLNLWLPLSRCGDEAPGLDVVPRRLEEHVPLEEGAFLEIVSQETAERAAGEKGIVRPIFEPGDAMFFDEFMLHKTGSDPAMPNPRYAIESWFFAASAFPGSYAPIAL